jgi:acetoin utilization deacetylase AcuC-like enzyme
MKECFFTIVDSPAHQFPGHPECPGRFEKMLSWITEPPYPGMHSVDFQPAQNEDLLRVHCPEMLLSLKIACGMGLQEIDIAPTYVAEKSFESALMAAGATLELSRKILSPGSIIRRGFAIVRPPGHHVGREEPGGFCLLNNLAIAVADALARNIKKVAIIDFDAHHGNGTQAIFLDDPRVGYFSLHQEGIFPGSGGLDEACLVEKRVINLPLPAYCGNEIFEPILLNILEPWLADFQPEMIFVSAGFDGHFDDPLTALNFSTSGFYEIAKDLIRLAETYSQGRILFVLEGGYAPESLADNTQAVLCALVEGDHYPNTAGESDHAHIDIHDRIRLVCKLHDLA